MTDLLGQPVAPEFRQKDLLSGSCGLGVNATWKVIDGVPYVRTPSGYIVRADGTGPLIPDEAPEGGDLPLVRQEKTEGISKSGQTPTE